MSLVILSAMAVPGPSRNVTRAGLQRRQDGSSSTDSGSGFLAQGNATSSSCSNATTYEQSGGQLINGENGIPFSVDAGVAYINFTTFTPGSISTDFEVIGNVLHWYNSQFYNGAAGFCELDGTVYATFTEEGGPIGCTSIDLVLYARHNDDDDSINRIRFRDNGYRNPFYKSPYDHRRRIEYQPDHDHNDLSVNGWHNLRIHSITIISFLIQFPHVDIFSARSIAYSHTDSCRFSPFKIVVFAVNLFIVHVRILFATRAKSAISHFVFGAFVFFRTTVSSIIFSFSGTISECLVAFNFDFDNPDLRTAKYHYCSLWTTNFGTRPKHHGFES
ncbi:hypothetical protein VSDG_05284 [Cytospora chrysosperma]|uniref:DUF7908 domain-containing protein n=1 Tax=Cytospora chrysosperma TaxID=252740 RepID=A0A423VXA6_CYTCH|nr:hypothetical protein VSDG_05284 [Valsa sordida]